jgi:polysaccharide export outer membrane protein
MAGGLNPFAKGGSIKIFREVPSNIKVFYFDYDDVSKGNDLNQNIRLKRGDVVVVP